MVRVEIQFNVRLLRFEARVRCIILLREGQGRLMFRVRIHFRYMVGARGSNMLKA